MNEEIVDLEVPKFTLKYSAKLNDVLKNMRMVLPFQGNADFTGTIDGSIYINEVIQKTYLSVDEQGTEASSITEKGVVEGIQPTTYLLVVNFLYII